VNTNCGAISLTPTSLNPSFGVPFSVTISASGGSGSYTFSIQSGSLPTGLTITSGGLVSGTTNAGGTFNVTIKATDLAACIGTQFYSITVKSVNVYPLAIANATLDTPYTQTMIANGTAAAPFTFTATGVPSDLVLSTAGVLSGSPSTFGMINNIDVTATSSDGYSANRTYSLNVVCATDVSVTPNQLDKAIAEQEYSNLVSTSRGQGFYDFTLAPGGQLPSGLSLSTSGWINNDE